MTLNNCELIPAVIQSVKDPKKLGRIKCVIPGIIDTSTMSEENIPWCYPFCMNAYQSFSKPIPGQKVWVIINKANYNEYWYLPFFEYNEISKDYLENVYDNDNPEILVSRVLGDNSAMSTYNDKDGFSERIGDNHIDLHPDGHISLFGGNCEVDIDGDIVRAGSVDETPELTIKGETFVDIISSIAEHLQNAIAGQPPHLPVTPVFITELQAIHAELHKITSDALAKHVKVN